MSSMRIVVADQAEAILYDRATPTQRPTEVARLADPAAHLHDRDFSSDRPGRSYESVGRARHAIERENDPRQREAVRFAREIASRLELDRRSGQYDQLVVVAGAAFLGMLRAELAPATRACVVQEVAKDLVHSAPASLARYLPESLTATRPA
jgi:protein required for attachment to host cells